MATKPTPIDSRLLELARRLANERHCSVNEILQDALDQIERPGTPAKSILGLFTDSPELMDQVLDDVYRTREQGTLRQSADLEAIREAVADMHVGDEGIPLDEAFESIRRKYGLADLK